MKVVLAGVLELADETDSKSVVLKDMWVRVPPPAPEKKLLKKLNADLGVFLFL